MSAAQFTIAFTGPGTDDGVMDVRELAPSLLAIGTLFDAANAALNGEAAQVRVNVRATKQACFEVDLELGQTIVQQLLQVMGGDAVSGALNIVELVCLGGGAAAATGKSLLWLIKKLRGKTPDKITMVDKELVRLSVDGETFEVPLRLLRLFQNIAVRDAVEKVVDPIGKSGIDGIEFRNHRRETAIRIDEADKAVFARPEVADETILNDTRRAAFSILSLAFKEDNKWRLHDGNAPISALISDKSFLERVDKNEVSFAKGDILLCDVAVIQKRTRDGLKTDYEVTRVVEHQPAARQLPLDFS